ncbi:hypothetical protein FRC09_005894 [Ceratobasidium sp. 395]|nr:hypothetical protein FRC09_005894 [Ceratobasidium sp. 395]
MRVSTASPASTKNQQPNNALRRPRARGAPATAPKPVVCMRTPATHYTRPNKLASRMVTDKTAALGNPAHSGHTQPKPLAPAFPPHDPDGSPNKWFVRIPLESPGSAQVFADAYRATGSLRRARASAPSQDTQEAPPEPSASDKRRLDVLKEAGKMARVVRERYRRQAVATAAGVRLEEVDPNPSDDDPLETDLVHDNEPGRAAKEAEAAGDHANHRKRKPSARDLFGYEREIISAAKLHLLAYSLKEGAIQTRGTFSTWADKCWMKTMREVLPGLKPTTPTLDIKQIMINGLATGRGRFKDPIRPLVQYELGLLKPAMTPEEINHNLEVFARVHPNTFHCTQFDPPYGHYESTLLTHAIAATMFGHPGAVGVVYQNYFNPIPLVTVAFVLAITQFCLEEWRTGQFKPRDLSMTDLLNKYVAHLRGLKEARAAAHLRMERLQQHWFDFGMDYSGSSRPSQKYSQPVTLRSDVRPDTPESDIELVDPEEIPNEPEEIPDEYSNEVDENGRYTARAKGKGRRID